MERAWAILEVKSVDDEQRIIEGIASTPTTDRGGDIVAPEGAQFSLPLPLLWQHDQQQPIGEVIAADVSPTRIAITARIARIDEPGDLQKRLDTAWQTVKAKLVRGLSIGFKPIEMLPLKGGTGFHIKRWHWAELSAVTIPSNTDATILAIKSADQAALGPHSPGATGSFPIVRVTKDAPTMGQTHTIGEQITAFEQTRAAKVAQLEAIQNKAKEESRTKDAAEKEGFNTLKAEITSIDSELLDLREMERINIAQAMPITTKTAIEATAQPIITVKANLPPATGFIRYVKAMAVSHGSRLEAAEYAKQWRDSTPEVELILKAAVAAGTTTDATWAGPLVQLQNLTAEFLALLRPATVLGKIPKLRKVPFNVSVPSQTGGGTYQWVGQGAPKPVGKLAFSAVTLGITKCAGIIAITDELARSSTPDAEATIRQDMINGIAAFLDLEFTDPTKAAVANVSPGSITNGITALTSAGTTPANARTDLQALIAAINAAGISTASVVVLMSEGNALALGFALNPLGQPLFPSLGVTGGNALGVTVIASSAMGAHVIALDPNSILYADDGGVTIDASREASVQMDSAPTNPADATTVLTSFWQNNLIGLRAERYINWKRARTGAVQWLDQTYVA